MCSLGLFGNLTVILVIWKDRVISKHRQNLYLLSLAVADASLVVLVVPFSLTNELLGHWPFGAVYCRIYLSVDILLCTASIWNICVIGLDRYISVKYPMTYRKFRTMPKIRLFIISVWLFAAGVSLLPFVSEIETINSERGCFINASSWYIVASCLLSFFVPSFIIWPVYIKIYMIVVLEPRHHPTPNQNGRNGVVDRPPALHNLTGPRFETTAFRRGSGKTGSSEDFMKLLDVPNNTNTGSRSLSTDQQMMVRSQSFIASSGHEEGANLLFSSPTLKPKDPKLVGRSSKPKVHQNFRSDTTSHRSAVYLTEYSKSLLCCCMHARPKESSLIVITPHNGVTNVDTRSSISRRLQSISPSRSANLVRKKFPPNRSRSSCANAMSRRERRFVCIISIITGCFMACWMPFFLTYSIYAICRNCCLNNTLFKVFFWLGYLNSALNPVLYTAFNKDFRSAFKRLFRADSNRTSR
uniref:G-protein coupled receptors family 1 profile domain-containing protein n=1 Tax=Ciona savignyi TaxID=51511 RepID=H2ZCJ6_CIOSA